MHVRRQLPIRQFAARIDVQIAPFHPVFLHYARRDAVVRHLVARHPRHPQLPLRHRRRRRENQLRPGLLQSRHDPPQIPLVFAHRHLPLPPVQPPDVMQPEIEMDHVPLPCPQPPFQFLHPVPRRSPVFRDPVDIRHVLQHLPHQQRVPDRDRIPDQQHPRQSRAVLHRRHRLFPVPDRLLLHAAHSLTNDVR